MKKAIYGSALGLMLAASVANADNKYCDKIVDGNTVCDYTTSSVVPYYNVDSKIQGLNGITITEEDRSGMDLNPGKCDLELLVSGGNTYYCYEKVVGEKVVLIYSISGTYNIADSEIQGLNGYIGDKNQVEGLNGITFPGEGGPGIVPAPVYDKSFFSEISRLFFRKRMTVEEFKL